MYSALTLNPFRIIVRVFELETLRLRSVFIVITRKLMSGDIWRNGAFAEKNPQSTLHRVLTTREAVCLSARE